MRDYQDMQAEINRLEEQIKELEETINKAVCDSVVIASPIDLRRLIKIDKPSTYVLYDLVDMKRPFLREKIDEFISGMRADAEKPLEKQH